MKIIDSIVAQAGTIAAIRRDIHAHPELCFEEVRTADIVARRLTEWGIPIHRGMGTTGVVGIVHGRDGGASGRAIGLRADMDALPMQEYNQFAHASRHAGKMHACGHDGHTAMLLAAAQHLAQHRPFDGTVYLIFQPAEEGGGGAREMIKDGLFDRFAMEAVFGMHNWPGNGRSRHLRRQPRAGDGLQQRVQDHHPRPRRHAALPHNGIDPVPVACQMVQAFQTIVSRNKKPIDAAVRLGDHDPHRRGHQRGARLREIQGTVRTFTLEVLDLIEHRMREIAEHTAAAFGATCEFDFVRNYPPTVNSAPEAAFARQRSWKKSSARRRWSPRSRPWAPKTSPTCCRPNPALTALSPTATAATGKWVMARARACCTTPVTTSTTI
jgi:amidohydrolase